MTKLISPTCYGTTLHASRATGRHFGGNAMEADDRTRAELVADLEIARQHAGRFKRAAAIVKDDLVESALRTRVRELETLVAVLEAKITKTAS